MTWSGSNAALTGELQRSFTPGYRLGGIMRAVYRLTETFTRHLKAKCRLMERVSSILTEVDRPPLAGMRHTALSATYERPTPRPNGSLISIISDLRFV